MDISTLRVRLFCRLLQRELIDQVCDKPSYRLVISALDSRGFDTSKISASTWNDWWHGRRKPNITMRATINAVTNNIASKWLEPCLVNNRLACHLSSLELGLSETNSTRQEAQTILQTIHNDWFVNRNGIVTTHNTKSRGITTLGQLSEPRISFDKGEETELSQPVSQSIISCYDTLNTSSIALFLLRMGVTNCKCEQGLDEVIAVDLASVACAGACILMSDYRYIKNMGKTGRLIMDLFDFWFADEGITNETGWILSTSLETVLINESELGRLMNLRDSYRSLMADTGISVLEINKQAKKIRVGVKL